VAMLEAMATGRAVVATAVGGIPEVLTHGRSGLLVPPHSPPSLAAALRRLLDMTEGERTGLGREGQALVLQRYSVEVVVGRTLALYREILESGERA